MAVVRDERLPAEMRLDHRMAPIHDLQGVAVIHLWGSPLVAGGHLPSASSASSSARVRAVARSRPASAMTSVPSRANASRSRNAISSSAARMRASASFNGRVT